MKKRTVRDLDPRGKRVFLRVDFNVPLADDGSIRNDARIRAALPTVNLLLEQGAKVIVASHLGKPKGSPDLKLSLRPVAGHLAELLDRRVEFASDCVGPTAERVVANAPPGSVVLLENLRFHPGEEDNATDFARALAALADEYVNDAFGTAHRTHASTVRLASEFGNPAAGLLMEKEIEYLSRVVDNPAPPFVAIIGGAKVSDKAQVVANLLPKVDHLLTGGGLMFTLLKARGVEVGRSLFEPDFIEAADRLSGNPRLVIPTDAVVAPGPDAANRATTTSVDNIPSEMMGLDIGPTTAGRYAETIARARTVVWAGPMGVFEKDAFAAGSETVARAVAAATEAGTTTVVGGGDTLACLAKWDLLGKVSHASTGGSACLRFLEGRILPGIAALAETK